jgi:hypothetical protein
MTLEIGNPHPQFGNPFTGDLVDGGKLYIGTVGADPEASPVACFWDEALTLTAFQPIRTRGGYIVNGSNIARLYTAATDYSIRLRDSDDSQIFYLTSVTVGGVASQPLNANLTAIAALTTTSYGRSLLTLANQAALQAAVGLVASLPLSGGTVTGGIIRASAGAYVYNADPAHTNGSFTDIGPSDALPAVSNGALVGRLET